MASESGQNHLNMYEVAPALSFSGLEMETLVYKIGFLAITNIFPLFWMRNTKRVHISNTQTKWIHIGIPDDPDIGI